MNKEIQSLVNQLNAASDAYYNGRDELMTDYEWDAAFDKLKKLEEETGIILPDSPTQNVSADNVTGKKEEHEFPALSLAILLIFLRLLMVSCKPFPTRGIL